MKRVGCRFGFDGEGGVESYEQGKKGERSKVERIARPRG